MVVVGALGTAIKVHSALRADLHLSGVRLPFGIRAELLRLIRIGDASAAYIAERLIDALDPLCAEGQALALDLRSSLYGLHATALSTTDPTRSAKLLKKSIEDGVQVLAITGEDRLRHWLLGHKYRRAFNVLGDQESAHAAVEHFIKAAELDPDWPAPIVVLAELASDSRFSLRSRRMTDFSDWSPTAAPLPCTK